MPFTNQIPAKSVGLKHLSFKIDRNKKSAIATSIVTQKSVEAVGMRDLMDKRVPTFVNRFGTATFRESGYIIPTIADLTVTRMAWTTNSQHEYAGNVDMRLSASDVEISTSRAGLHEINVSWSILLDDASLYETKYVYLYLYKNGVKVDTLDAKQVYVQIPTLTNFHFDLIALQGSKVIELDVDDYIDIRYEYEQFATGTNWTSPTMVSGYIDMKYICNKLEGI